MEKRDQRGLTEEEFLSEYKKKNYPRPYLTADIVVLDKACALVLLIQRKGHPFLGQYALPGGFAKPDETIEDTARRELFEETSVRVSELEPIGLFSKPGRDPRGWVVSQAFLAVTAASEVRLKSGDDAADALWFHIAQEDGALLLRSCSDPNIVLDATHDLAFDHGEVLLKAFHLFKKKEG